MKRCQPCSLDFPENAEFCESCGGKLIGSSALTTIPLHCPNCDAPVEPDWKFCKNCRTRLALPASPPSVEVAQPFAAASSARANDTLSPDLRTKGTRFRWTFFALILFCFLLPFVQVSCQQQRLISLTGIQTAFGTEVVQPQMFGSPQTKQISGDITVLLCLLAAFAGLGSSFLRGRLGTLIGALSGSFGFLLLIVFKMRLDSEVVEQGGGVLNVEYLFGFTASCLLFLAAGLLNGYLFFREAGERSLYPKDKKFLLGTTIVLAIIVGIFVLSLPRHDSSKAQAQVDPNQNAELPISTPLEIVTAMPSPKQVVATSPIGIVDEFNGSSIGDAAGITFTPALNGQGAVFSRENQSRIQYQNKIPSEGTLEWWINVKSGYHYSDYKLVENETSALIFTTDIQGGDVTWPGSTWFFVNADGTLSLVMATTKYDGPRQNLKIQATNFRFNQWHSIGISFGSHGQYIMLDGVLVASAKENTQTLGRGGTHEAAIDIPTVGEAKSSIWERHRWDGGFEGIVDRFRISSQQEDWSLSAQGPQ